MRLKRALRRVTEHIIQVLSADLTDRRCLTSSLSLLATVLGILLLASLGQYLYQALDFVVVHHIALLILLAGRIYKLRAH